MRLDNQLFIQMTKYLTFLQSLRLRRVAGITTATVALVLEDNVRLSILEAIDCPQIRSTGDLFFKYYGFIFLYSFSFFNKKKNKTKQKTR